jgi:phytoene desaturase
MAKLIRKTSKNNVSKNIVIIGSGFGGLAASALLSKQGHNVTLLEKNDSHGGRARVWKSKGFTFDMGPSWYLMPDVFEKFYHELGTSPDKELKLKLLSPSYRIFFGKNKDKNGQDVNKIVDVDSGKRGYDLFDTLEKDGTLKLKKYLKQSEYQYNIAMDGFIYKEYNSIFDMISYKTMVEGSKLKVFDNMDKFTRRFFDSDEARKILEYNLVFLGGDPKNTPALYSIMAHIDFNMGVWYPIGGLGEVTTSIMNIAKNNGAKFVFNSPVNKILVEDGKVKGVSVKKGNKNIIYDADIVISNADYQFTETKLLEDKYVSYPQKFWDKKIVAPSAFIVYLGLNKKIKNLKHHNLFLENDWMKHFREIFENPTWPENPSYYICCPSKTDSTVAPKGCENMFILVPVASGIVDNDKVRKTYFNKTISHVEKLLGEKISKNILVKRIFSLNDFKNDYNAFKGTALGISHTLLQTGYFRPHQRSKKVKNLFYVGQYTHPGIGMPMAIISSQIVSDIIKKEF